MINRREFLAVAAAAAMPLPALALPPRTPFLEVGDHVDFLYFEDWERLRYPHFGPPFVAAIGAWNGSSYEVSLEVWSHRDRTEYFTGFDSEWCMFRKEVPDFSWAKPGMSERYPNIHAYVREKRFGEDPAALRARMDHNQHSGNPLERRAIVPLRKTVWPEGVPAK